MNPVPDVARIRLDNALRLFDEFVRATVKQADAATLRGLERRFAERLQIQPSYWSQIKGRSRQIGERLARQFEQLCKKPVGWMDQAHGDGASHAVNQVFQPLDAADASRSEAPASQPLDDDERFIVGLVLTYYRRHPQRARARLLDLLGEVLAPPPAATAATAHPPAKSVAAGQTRLAAGARTPAAAPADDMALWLRSQSGVAPLKPRR
jgi:hypothetical protein